MNKAVHKVLSKELSIRKAAEKYDVKFQTLARYVKKKKDNPDGNVKMRPNYEVNQVFNAAVEATFVNYITQMSAIGFGLTPDGVRRLAYQAAEVNNIPVPDNWKKEQKAGKKWFTNFRKRNQKLSIRAPENCSLARASAFNEHICTMDEFFDKLETIYARHPQFSQNGNLVWNLDETSTTTVSKSPKVVAKKGIHQVNQITSAEHGILTTTCCFISAGGNTIPPVIVYPRKNVKAYKTKGAPTGSKTLCSSSGWMTDDLFIDVMTHFIQCTKPSKNNPVFLLYDNHSSHISLRAGELAKENGVIILTIPPHTSHRVQPLDVGVFSSFKNHYAIAQKRWTDAHPGQTITLQDIPEFVAFAHEQSTTKANIMSGFKKTGIFPCNRCIFTDNDYVPSDVTDRPNPNVESATPSITPPVPATPSSNNQLTAEEIQITPDDTNLPTSTSTSGSTFCNPFEFRGIPKAGARKKSNRGRKSKTSVILTDTSEQDRLRSENAEKIKKQRKTATVRGKLKFGDSDNTDEEDEPMRIKANGKKVSALTVDSSESEGCSNDESHSSLGEDTDFSEDGIEKVKNIGDYVLAVFSNEQKGHLVHYVGCIMKISKNEAKVKFLKKSEKYCSTWIYPLIEDVAWIHFNKIK